MDSPDYFRKLGLKAGLEIHQQLLTKKKLFCRCPVELYKSGHDGEILRHMRPTLSELGEYDGTALMEFKTKKEIIYHLYHDVVCTYEMDDTPPFPINDEALDISIEIALILGCSIVNELHIARKQYLDGSIPTGFQRTAIVGLNGSVPFKGRELHIQQLSVEEDSCRQLSDEGHVRTFRTDRLSVPLVEVVTKPELHTPQEVAEAALLIGRMMRSSGKVRRGVGATRQDVNVSIEGGTRVEIKGVPKVQMIASLVAHEAVRQKRLLEIKEELMKRGIREDNFRYSKRDITDTLKGTSSLFLKEHLRKGERIFGVKLSGYRGILDMELWPHVPFLHEIRGRVKVIACLDRMPNLVNLSSMSSLGIPSFEVDSMRSVMGVGPQDELVIVWGPLEDAKTAAEEIAIRAKEACCGVPNETRQVLPDGTTDFERILPGPDRMYPDTDLPPKVIDSKRLERIRQGLPEPVWVTEERYKEWGLNPALAYRMVLDSNRSLFEEAVKGGVPAAACATFLLEDTRWFRRYTGREMEPEEIREALNAAKKGEIRAEALHGVARLLGEGVPVKEALDRLSPVEDFGKVVSLVDSVVASGRAGASKNLSVSFVMGRVMESYRWRVDGKRVYGIVMERLRPPSP